VGAMGLTHASRLALEWIDKPPSGFPIRGRRPGVDFLNG